MTAHSRIVGGSTAKRVLACPGSIPLVQKVPPLPTSVYAEEGTRLHELIAMHLSGSPVSGEEKIDQALELLDELDPRNEMEYEVEQRVEFPDIEGAFGSVDLIGRLGDVAVVLDWKFGSGIPVDAEENEQLMFYAASAMATPGLEWIFKGAKQIELVIVQPPHMKRWRTSFERINRFVDDLIDAVTRRTELAIGEHCRWCPAKIICPAIDGSLQRTKQNEMLALFTPQQMSERLREAVLLRKYADELEEFAFKMLDEGVNIPGYKLVPKQARRQWVDTAEACDALLATGLTESELLELRSPAQIEKILKGKLPEGLTVAISSGNTIAPESDPRPRVVDIKKHLSKLGA
jgi:hypothetical protein